MDSNSQSYEKWKIWLMAARPKTLWAGITPVIMGGAIAFEANQLHLITFCAALAGSVLIQIGTNFANDLFDYLKKTDTQARVGPMRVTQAGLVSPQSMKWATAIVFGLAVLVGFYLVLRGGMPILIIGILSIMFGILYTAGPYPLSYTGWADLFVIVFFGPVAVAGTYYVNALEMNLTAILAGLPVGMISTAILTVNNLRDYETDKIAGKRSLAVRFGKRFAKAEYFFLMIGALCFPISFAIWLSGHAWILISLCSGLIMISPIKKVFQIEGAALNDVLAQTGKALALFGILFSIGWNL